MRVQGMPVHEQMSICPQLLSLPMPGPREAYYHDCAEYRPIPGGGPVDNPASHRSEVIHASNHQVNCDHDEHIPPGEERAPPNAGWRACCVPTNLSRALLLCMLPLRRFCYIAWCPKGNQLYHLSWCTLPLIGSGNNMQGAIKQLSWACYTGCHTVNWVLNWENLAKERLVHCLSQVTDHPVVTRAV